MDNIIYIVTCKYVMHTYQSGGYTFFGPNFELGLVKKFVFCPWWNIN